MSTKTLLLIFALCVFSTFAVQHKKKSKFLGAHRITNTRNCDFDNYATCTNPQYILNRATGYYLGRGNVYNTAGFDAVLDYNYDKWCINNCFITNTVNGFVLDVAESDLTRKHVIVWPIHADTNGNQVWVATKESTGFWSIKTQTDDSNLALASVDDHFPPTNGLTLLDFDVNDVRQQWTIQE